MDWSHNFSGELQVILFSFSFFDAILTLLSFVFFSNGHKIFDEINVCCCCLILLFVLTCFLVIGNSHESNTSFVTPLSYLLWRLSFRSYTKCFFEKYLSFWGFLSVPYLADNYAKIVDERGRNLMCDRTLPSLLVRKSVKRILRWATAANIILAREEWN